MRPATAWHIIDICSALDISMMSKENQITVRQIFIHDPSVVCTFWNDERFLTSPSTHCSGSHGLSGPTDGLPGRDQAATYKCTYKVM